MIKAMEALKTVLSTASNLAISGLLKSLDSFKVLMCRKIEQLYPIEASLTSHPIVSASALTLEFQTCPVEEVYKHINWTRSDIVFLVEALTVTRTDKAQVIPVLDLLTTLCILLGGEVEEKARLLFKWYNINKQGLMEEEEHYLMIRRVGLCLKKLHILGNVCMVYRESCMRTSTHPFPTHYAFRVDYFCVSILYTTNKNQKPLIIHHLYTIHHTPSTIHHTGHYVPSHL